MRSVLLAAAVAWIGASIVFVPLWAIALRNARREERAIEVERYRRMAVDAYQRSAVTEFARQIEQVGHVPDDWR